jgi:hypothetical protein
MTDLQNTTGPDARLAFEPIVRPCLRVQVLLDLSPDAIDARVEKHRVQFWQLRTPLTAYRIHGGVPYALDNGCFGGSLPSAWGRMIEDAKRQPPLWATSPDVVGSARRTLELWPRFARQMNGVPRALVLQDGIGDHEIPWGELAAVFIGGSDAFKSSAEARHAAVTARMLGKLVHVGRVNTWERAREWADLADSYDGSGISRDPRDEQLAAVLAGIRGEPATMPLFDA